MLRNPDKIDGPVPASEETRGWIRSSAVVSRVVAGETLIVPIRGNVGDLASIYSFNHTGTLIWKLLEKENTLEGLVDGVAREYGVERDRVKSDVQKFVEELTAAGLLEISRAAALAGD
jgi:Coenzyme PQQ synthesis protein D (PqqD)